MEDGFVKVVSPIEDTPAYKAGLKPGDLIIKLDDASVKGMTLNDAVKRMRGKPDTQITLTVLRKGENKPLATYPDARRDQDAERQIQDARARLRLRPYHPVPGTHRRRPGEGAEIHAR